MSKDRLFSLDLLRGLDVFWLIVAQPILEAANKTWALPGWLRAQLVHGNNPEGVEFLKKKAAEELNCSFEETVPVAPALGAHTGPSLAGIIVGPQALFSDLM